MRFPPPGTTVRPPIIRITNGTFYRHQPSSHGHGHGHGHPNPPLFSNLTLDIPSHPASPHNWAILGPSQSGKTSFLQLLRGQYLCFPPTARSFPYLSTEDVPARLRGNPAKAIQYVGFDATSTSGGLGAAASSYISARYESHREQTDFSVKDWLLGNTELNPTSMPGDYKVDEKLFERVVVDLRLDTLLDLPVSFLSNGQGRRARIARALFTDPEVLLLDEPFMGLDPATVAGLSPLLQSLAEKKSPRLVLAARPQDPLPEWITHLVYLRTDSQVGAMGERGTVLDGLRAYVRGVWKGGLSEDETMPVHALIDIGRTLTKEGVKGEGLAEALTRSPTNQAPIIDSAPVPEKTEEEKEPLVEMSGVTVRYGSKTVLGNWPSGLHWTVRRGSRWGVFGPNGSGKTTIVSLLCSDHPQTYSLPIKLFGRSRLPEPGSGERPLTFWDIQSRVGHSSPEIHQYMPRRLTVRSVLESAWADTFSSVPKLTPEATGKVDATLSWFAHELNPSFAKRSHPTPVELAQTDKDETSLKWAKDYQFGELPFSSQRLLLFLRAIVKNPDIVVLDEAFSGMDDAVRDKCMLFLMHGENKTFASSSSSSSSSSSNASTPTTKTKNTGLSVAPVEVIDSEQAKAGQVRVHGLTDEQALICISHIKEEVPDCVREWVCLPEASSGQEARFGRLDGPLRLSGRRWGEVWGVNGN